MGELMEGSCYGCLKRECAVREDMVLDAGCWILDMLDMTA